MVVLKAGVSLAGLKPPMLEALAKIAAVARTQGRESIVVTSTTEGVHKGSAERQSLHYTGLAADIRVDPATPEKNAAFAAAVRAALGSGYDVVYGNVDHLNHIHIEYDPKE